MCTINQLRILKHNCKINFKLNTFSCAFGVLEILIYNYEIVPNPNLGLINPNVVMLSADGWDMGVFGVLSRLSLRGDAQLQFHGNDYSF